MRKRIKKNKFTILWIIVILVLCLIPSSEIPKSNFIIPHFDKIAHLGMFFILSLIYNHEQKTKKFSDNLFPTIILTIYLAILTETVQKTLTSDRQFDIIDIMADVSGSIFGYFVFLKQKIIK